MKKQNQILILLSALILVIIVRLSLTLKFPLANYGYDYGFYLYALKTTALSVKGLLVGAYGGYGTLLWPALKLLPIPSAAALSASFFVVQILLGLSFFWFYRNKNTVAALWAVVLFALSIPQNEAYSLFLFKTALALIFLLLAFKFLIDRRYWLFGICSALLLISHRTTAIFYLLTLAAYGAYEMIRQRRWRWLAAGFAAAVIAGIVGYILFRDSLAVFLRYPNQYVVQGIFLPNLNFWTIDWMYILLAIPGVWLYIKHKRNPIILIFLLITALWSLFKLPFYYRVLQYIDLGLILFGAYALANLSKKRALQIILGLLVIVVAGWQVIRFNTQKYPLIDTADTQEISNFNRQHPGSFVLAVSANDAPWLLGYAEATRLGAPGLFEDNHTYDQWIAFWSGQNQQEFLNEFPKPLYLYQRSFVVNGPITSCLQQISNNFYFYSCQ